MLACISADGTSLPPALIYKGESHDLQSTWVQDLQESDQCYFAATANGWSCDRLGLVWLEKVFERHTKQKCRGTRRRLLLVDGHSSHVNMKFIELADCLWILVMILPPHSTHRLQPLDVGLFQPLAIAYTKQPNTLMSSSYWIVSKTKRMFWPMFQASWNEAFTAQNINSAFAKTGVFPSDSSKVLTVIQKKAESPKPPINPPTPMSSRAIRRTQKAYKHDPSTAVAQLFRAANVLAAQHSIDEHEKRGLRQALQLEKKKRQRGKRLNLVGEEDSGPQFFSPGRVQKAKAVQAAREAEEQQKRDDIANRKAQAAAKKERMEAEKAVRALQKAARRQLAQEAKALQEAGIRARKEQRLARKEAKKAAQKAKRQSTAVAKGRKRGIGQVVQAEETIQAKKAKVVLCTTSRGRAVARPQRYN